MRASQIVRDSTDVCPALLMAQAVTKYNTGNFDMQVYLCNLNETPYKPFLDTNNVSYYGVTHFGGIPLVFNQATAFNASDTLTVLANEISDS